MPAPVTGLDSGFTARDAVNAFRAIDLDWSGYNERGQKDMVRYRIYVGPSNYDDVSGMEPYDYAPAETKRWTVTGLDPLGIYYLAVVAEDVLGHWTPVVRSASAQASVDRVREVRNLAVACGTNSLMFTWMPPEGADPHTNNLLASYRVYLAGAGTPVTLDRMALSYTATSLLPAHGYPFRISTVDNTNRESDGASLLAATLVPNPSETTVNSSYGTTWLAWERVQPEEVIERFEVYMAQTNFTFVVGMAPVRTTRGTSVEFPDLTFGQAYYFAVVTRNISGCESPDLPLRVVTFTPTGLQPGAYANGVFSIIVNGPVGADYVLLGSTNLSDWARLQTNTPAVLPFAVTVTNVPGMNSFYRVKVE